MNLIGSIKRVDRKVGAMRAYMTSVVDAKLGVEYRPRQPDWALMRCVCGALEEHEILYGTGYTGRTHTRLLVDLLELAEVAEVSHQGDASVWTHSDV